MRTLLFVSALCVASVAQAQSTFVLTIRNTSASNWASGLLATRALLTPGAAPQSASTQYPAYASVVSGCQISDSFCSGACDDTGNPTVLAQRMGLTIGTNAWVIPALTPNTAHTVTITANAPDELSYLAWVQGSGDDFVAMHVPGNPADTTVPLFSGGQPVGGLQFSIGGYDAASVDAANGGAGNCAATCPPSASGCFVASGNGTTGGTLSTPATQGVAHFTAVSGNQRNTLNWTRVAPHRGVLIIRRANQAIAGTWTPTNGQAYSPGQTIQPGANPTQVAYFDDVASGGAYASFPDTGLTNGTRYYYKAFAYTGAYVYDSGNVPSNQGILSIPTSQTGTDPIWCYTVGVTALQQPVTELGAAVFTAGNGGAVTANRTTGDPATEGFERFRPVQLSGAVQARFPVVPLAGRSGTYIVTGDQGGRAWVINAQTGSVVWGGIALPNVTSIQAQPAVQLLQYANAGYQAAHPGRDLIFVASRNTAGANYVYALSSVDGSVVWTYSAANMGVINGGMMVDYTNNRLWVASNGNPSLRILNSLTGALLGSLNLGNIDTGVVQDFQSGQAYVVNTNGNAYGVSLSSMTQVWTQNLGGITASYLWPLGNGFISARLGGGMGNTRNRVRRYSVNGGAVTLNWTVNVTSPTGVTVDYAAQQVYFGAADGIVRRVNLADGSSAGSITVVSTSPTNIGTPTVDKVAGRFHIGTIDGRICAFDLP